VQAQQSINNLIFIKKTMPEKKTTTETTSKKVKKNTVESQETLGKIISIKGVVVEVSFD
jgi:hypothetical protein